VHVAADTLRGRLDVGQRDGHCYCA
jgi:hypothetical protein